MKLSDQRMQKDLLFYPMQSLEDTRMKILKKLMKNLV